MLASLTMTTSNTRNSRKRLNLRHSQRTETVVQVSLIPIKVEYVEWTLGSEGSGPKLRAPVYARLWSAATGLRWGSCITFFRDPGNTGKSLEAPAGADRVPIRHFR